MNSSFSHVISDKPPTEIDFQQTRLIEEFLKKENRYPPEEEDRKREEVLGTLHELINEWVREVSMNQVCILPQSHIIIINIRLTIINNLGLV
jgi:poly(A) polymerase Pap1